MTVSSGHTWKSGRIIFWFLACPIITRGFVHVKNFLWRTAPVRIIGLLMSFKSLGAVENLLTDLGKYRFWHIKNARYAHKEHLMSDCTVVFV